MLRWHKAKRPPKNYNDKTNEAAYLSEGYVANVGRAIVSVVAGHVTAGENQSPIFAATVAEAGDRPTVEQQGQRTC